MFKHHILPIVAAITLPHYALAQSDQDRVRVAQEALSAGNEKIAIYAASDPTLPLEIRLEAGRLSFARGYTPSEEGTGTVSKSVTWSPVLSYDNDINGGARKDGFSFGGFDFLIPEESRRKSGVVIGSRSDGFLRYSMGRQTVIDLSAGSYVVYAPQHEIWKMSASGSACATRQIERDLYVSACWSLGASKNDLSSELNSSFSGSLTKIVDLGSYVHELEFSLSQNHSRSLTDEGAYDQKKVEISGQAINDAGHVFGYSAMVGEKVDDRKVRTLSLSARYGFDAPKGKAFIGASYSSFDGATWLGRSVDEEEYSVFVQAPIHERLSARMEATRIVSGSEINDGKDFSLFLDVSF